MKKNKGFTLIELLAIIVILAIIAVITVPIILNIIENSRKGAAQDSAYGYKDSVDKWYVSELSKPNNGNFNLASSYTVTDGKLNGSIEIPVSGEKPSSGYLNYSNNILTSGCLVFGDYAVTFNGNETSTAKGECTVEPQETVLYYTYDGNATADANGFKNSAKLPAPDSSWKYYIKETLDADSYYTIEYTQDDQLQTYGHYSTSAECETTMSSIMSPEDVETLQASCKNVIGSLYEVVGIKNYGTADAATFTLRGNDYANSVNTVDTVFPTCNASSTFSVGADCSGSGILVRIRPSGVVTVGDSSAICGISDSGLAGCNAS